MNWNRFTQDPPPASGVYLVSIFRAYDGGNIAFNYIAYYNVENGKWYKYDPFVDTSNVQDEIEHQIIGWASELNVYIG